MTKITLGEDGLGQVTRMVDVDAVVDGHPVGKKLQGNRLTDCEQRFAHLDDVDGVVGEAATVSSPVLAMARMLACCSRMSRMSCTTFS